MGFLLLKISNKKGLLVIIIILFKKKRLIAGQKECCHSISCESTGRGVLGDVLLGEAPARVDKWYLFHIPHLEIPFSCCELLSLEYGD